jgi:hypothetical protein
MVVAKNLTWLWWVLPWYTVTALFVGAVGVREWRRRMH